MARTNADGLGSMSSVDKIKMDESEEEKQNFNMDLQIIFQKLTEIEKKIDIIYTNTIEMRKQVDDLHTDMKKVNAIIIKKGENIESEADECSSEMKTRLEEQMGRLEKNEEMNERAISTLFAKMNQSNAETQLKLKEMRTTQEIKWADCNGRVSGATEAMSTLFQSMLEKRIEKEVTSMAEKHKEEMSELTEKMEKMWEEFKKNQLSFKNQLKDGLKKLKIGNEIDGNIESLSEDTINVFKKITHEFQPRDFNLKNSIVVLKPEDRIWPVSNFSLPPSVKWTIYGLEKMIMRRKKFEVVSDEFEFPGYPFAVRVKMEWKEDDDFYQHYADFSMHFCGKDYDDSGGENFSKPLRLCFMMIMFEDPEYNQICSGKFIDKSFFTSSTAYVNDAVMIGICVDTKLCMRWSEQPHSSKDRLNHYRLGK